MATSRAAPSTSSKRGDRRQEVARVGEAVRADRAEVGQAEVGAEVLADVAARLTVEQLDSKANAARDDDDLLRLDVDRAELGDEALAAVLRDDEQLAVGVVERALLHRAVRRVDVRRGAGLHRGPPLPAIVTRPSTKSVGSLGIGSGFQRSWLGVASTSSNALTMRPSSMRANGSCIADGRMR